MNPERFAEGILSAVDYAGIIAFLAWGVVIYIIFST